MPASETSLVYTVSSRLCGEKLLKREIEKKILKKKEKRNRREGIKEGKEGNERQKGNRLFKRNHVLEAISPTTSFKAPSLQLVITDTQVDMYVYMCVYFCCQDI